MNDYLQRLALRGASSQASRGPAAPAGSSPAPIAEISVEVPAAAVAPTDPGTAGLVGRRTQASTIWGAPPRTVATGTGKPRTLEPPRPASGEREPVAPAPIQRQAPAAAHPVAIQAQAAPPVVVIETSPAEALTHQIFARDAPEGPALTVPTADPPPSERNAQIAVARVAAVAQSGGPFADRAAARTDPVAPAISIGRIQIDLTPPPQAVRPPPERTRGFSRYARARRGLKG